MNKLLLLLLLITGVFIICCNKKDDNRPAYSCNPSAAVIDTIENKTGTFLKLDNYNNYAIRLAVTNTIDEVKIYILCNAPLNLPPVEKVVTFSGAVRASTVKSEINGTEYFELDVTALE